MSAGPHPRRAFVTGGSGFVGSRLIERLVQSGWAVTALSRSAGSDVRVRALGGVPVRAALDDLNSLKAALGDAEVVFHAAAHFKMWGKRRDFLRVNVDGTRNLLKAAIANPAVRRFIYVSAAAVVMGEPTALREVDEDAPLQTPRWAPYSGTKALAEREVVAANNTRPAFETIILRPPFIWGPSMPVLDDVIETVVGGRFRFIGGGEQTMSTIHVDNLCHALLLAADQGRPGAAYFVTDGGPRSLRAVFTALLRTRGIEPPDKVIGAPLAWRVGTMLETAWRVLPLSGEPPLTRQMVRLVGWPFEISDGRARRDLGYEAPMPFEVGIDLMNSNPPTASFR